MLIQIVKKSNIKIQVKLRVKLQVIYVKSNIKLPCFRSQNAIYAIVFCFRENDCQFDFAQFFSSKIFLFLCSFLHLFLSFQLPPISPKVVIWFLNFKRNQKKKKEKEKEKKKVWRKLREISQSREHWNIWIFSSFITRARRNTPSFHKTNRLLTATVPTGTISIAPPWHHLHFHYHHNLHYHYRQRLAVSSRRGERFHLAKTLHATHNA